MIDYLLNKTGLTYSQLIVALPGFISLFIILLSKAKKIIAEPFLRLDNSLKYNFNQIPIQDKEKIYDLIFNENKCTLHDKKRRLILNSFGLMYSIQLLKIILDDYNEIKKNGKVCAFLKNHFLFIEDLSGEIKIKKVSVALSLFILFVLFCMMIYLVVIVTFFIASIVDYNKYIGFLAVLFYFVFSIYIIPLFIVSLFEAKNIFLAIKYSKDLNKKGRIYEKYLE